MSNEVSNIAFWVTEYLPLVLAAVAILVIGWIIALILSSVARKAVRRTSLGAKLASWLKGEEESDSSEAEKWVGRLIYYLALFFVLIAFFQFLGLTFIAEPLRGFVTHIFEYAPRIIGAALLLLIAWIVASVLRVLIIKVLTAAKIDERLGEEDLDDEKRTSLIQSIATVVYWLVFILFLPAILSALALEGLMVPVKDMLVVILSFLPNILAAALILIVGWIGARILQRFVVKTLSALGVDKVSDSAGVSNILGEQKISGLLGILVYAVVLIFAIIAALNALALEAITDPASNMLQMILASLPAIFAAALVLAIAYLVGRVIAGLVANILSAAGFDNILQRLGLSRVSFEGRKSPSEIVGLVVIIAIMLFAAMEAAGLLGFALLADLISDFLVILGQVAIGLVIFGIGLYLAGVAHQALLSSGGVNATLLARLAKISIIVLAGAMALSQMGVAQEIIIIGFGVLVGAIALTAVIAFGVGGRDLAARELDEWVKNFKSKE